MAPPVPGTKKWTRGPKIGEGKFATVFLASNEQNGKKFAVKSADKSNLETRLALENERKLLKDSKSPYIVKYLGCDMTDKVRELENINTFNLLLELVPKGSIFDQIRNTPEGFLPEEIVAAYTRDILKGLSYLHSKGIVHGDIRAANCLVGKENIKLCDLGSGKKVVDGDLPLEPKKGEHMKNRIFTAGTPGWQAPEVLEETEQGPPSDIYSLGCTVVEMCTGKPPSLQPVYESLAPTDQVNPETGLPIICHDIPQTFSNECRDFVDECLAPDPFDRPDSDELLKHVWFSSRPCPYPTERLPPPPPPPRPPSPPPDGVFTRCSKAFGCKC